MKLIICPDCNEKKRYFANGLCKVCHLRHWRQNNKEKKKAQNQRYYLKHKKKMNEAGRNWRQQNKKKIELLREKWLKSPQGRLYQSVQRQRRRSNFPAKREILQKVLDINLLRFGHNCCEKCHVNIDNNYHFDHIIPLSIGGDNSYDNLQLLCGRCNRNKGIEIADYRKNLECGQLFLGGVRR